MNTVLQRIRAILRHEGYTLYSRPYELNIVGIRGRSTVANRFDDEIHVFYKTGPLQWHYHVFKATTDPGTYWLRQPMQPQGTAILAQGQYVGAYHIAKHRGQYNALVQVKPVSIIRDYNRDAILDFNNGTKVTGLFGINIHRANKTGITLQVDNNSAGCQVFENAKDFDLFMQLCQKHSQLYGNRFTYTLIDFRAMSRQKLRSLMALLSALGLAGLGWALIANRDKVANATGKAIEFFKKMFNPTPDTQP